MMIFHGPSLSILGILLILHTHPSIHCSYGNLRALVDDGELVEQMNAEVERAMFRKIPIDLDVSRELPLGIIAIQSSWIPRHKSYFVEGQYYDNHRIGAVLDGNIMVLRGNEMSIERVVYLYNEHDGTRVLKITDLFDTPDDEMDAEITEMVKRPGEPSYEPLRRIPVDIDLLEKCPHQIDIHEYPDSEFVRYTIRNELRNVVIIGMVKYGHYIVEDRPNENVLEREIILRTNGERSELLVLSHMKDESTNRTRYLFRERKNDG